ncbi:hypothetical protein ACLOAU_04425 [Niabella sp. CJ426]|uniref:hypothetical protein n=1 Tax=Niabella sp. CJ426 TaxID=3393740 RepID=UPI003D05E58D
MTNQVLNGHITSTNALGAERLTKVQQQDMLTTLFEQLLIFEKVTIRTNRTNEALSILIQNLGFDTVERLVRSGYIKFMIWAPVLVTGTGRSRDDGTVDESEIYGTPPIHAATLADEDLDPEHNITRVLDRFGNIAEKRKRQFIKKARDAYEDVDGMDFSTNTYDLIIEAYQSNTLSELGLPYAKEPEQLDLNERGQLLTLGHQVLETAVLSEYNLKSYNNFEHLKICEKNLENIGRGYNVASNTSHLFELEKVPDLKEIYKVLHNDFDAVFKIRHMAGAKYYRKWINEIGDYTDAAYITSEYLSEIKGTYKYFDSGAPRFFKNAAIYGLGTALTSKFLDPTASAIVGYGFNLLEEYVIDGLLRGHNPSMFIENVKKSIP